MRISAVVGCKDEVTLLEPAVAALLRAGVATVSIFDDGSTDGSQELIARLTRDPRIHHAPPPTDLAAMLRFDGPLFGPILQRDAPDWVLFCDADEIWLPQSGDMRHTAGLHSHDVIAVERYNVAVQGGALPPGALLDGAFLRGMNLITERRKLTREVLQADAQARWILHRIYPKLMVRPAAVERYLLGADNVLGRDGQPPKLLKAKDMVIAHLPFTDYPRFERKVRNIATVFERYDAEHSGTLAWHWRHWLALYRAGGLEEEFHRQILDADSRAAMRARGGLISAAELFAARGFAAQP